MMRLKLFKFYPTENLDPDVMKQALNSTLEINFVLEFIRKLVTLNLLEDVFFNTEDDFCTVVPRVLI